MCGISFGKGINIGISDLRDPGLQVHLGNFKKYLDLSRNTQISFGAETSVKINAPYSIIVNEDENYNNSVPGFISAITTEWSKTVGFDDSYIYGKNADGPFLYSGISGDVMGAGDGTSRRVQWYHIAILSSIYGR